MLTELWNRAGSAGEPASGNFWQTALANEADTIATRTSEGILNVNGRNLSLIVVTANKIGTTATYTPSLQTTYNGGTTWFTIWTAAAALTANGTVLYTFGPGCETGAGTETENVGIPIYRDMRVVITVGGTANASHNMDTAAYVHLGV